MKIMENNNINIVKNKINESNKKWLAVTVTVFFVFFAIIITALFVFQYLHALKIYPGVMVGSINIGGLTQKQVKGKLSKARNQIVGMGLTFTYLEKTVVIPVEVTATDPDLSRKIFSFDINNTLARAYQHGRGYSWWQNTLKQINSLFYGVNVPAAYEINTLEIKDILKNSFTNLENPAQDARLIINSNNQISVKSETSGMVFDYDKALHDVRFNFSRLENRSIELETIIQQPKVYSQETGPAVKLAQEIINTSTPSLVYEDNIWKITHQQITDWLEFYKPISATSVVGLRLGRASTTEILLAIAKEIDVDAQDAKFTLENNRVTEFQPSSNGQKLHIDKNYAKINKEYIDERNKEIDLIVEEESAKIATGDLNDLGIKELLGRGISNFAGSPTNRRYNISVGANSLNGILIAPDEEFSLLEALGEIDGVHGYRKELVIKGDRTIPEYGGGLCQIGTTTFRAAIYSGLPITQRRNHSFRVRYYEPAGMDATIYDPYPDFKFINDTESYILFTTKIKGDDLIFEFYGSKDGRQIGVGKPKVYNITSPEEPRFIETDSLLPDEKKLVEHAVSGADTEFDYKVVYPNGEVYEKTFYSHYIPWRETWLIGKDPDNEAASSETETTSIDTEDAKIINSLN